MKVLREILRFLVYGGLFAVLAVFVLHRLDYELLFHPEVGWEADGVLLDFTPKSPEPPLAQPSAAVEPESPEQGDVEVKNVVFLLADGLGFPHLLAARAALVGVEGRLELERMPVSGWLTTHTASRLVTDSAASATALGSGFKTDSGVVGLDPSGEELRSAAEAARGSGRSVGLITDSYLFDASPAAFSAHVESRHDYPEVVAGMADSGIELLVGELPSRSEHPEEAERVVTAFADAGYAVARDLPELRRLAPAGEPVAGLFRYTSITRDPEDPSLEQLAEVALERLSADPEGFFLLVETEETDSGAHDHDLGRVIDGVAALDAVARTVLDFARRDGRTLVVFTADHETGGLLLLGGEAGEPMGIAWGTHYHTASPVPLLAYGPGAERLAGVRDNTDVGELLVELMSAAATDPSAVVDGLGQ